MQTTYGELLHRKQRMDLIGVRRLGWHRALDTRPHTSTKNDTNRLPGKIRKLGGATEHFRIHIERPQTTEYEMTRLRSEIEHQDSLGIVRQWETD